MTRLSLHTTGTTNIFKPDLTIQDRTNPTPNPLNH